MKRFFYVFIFISLFFAFTSVVDAYEGPFIEASRKNYNSVKISINGDIYDDGYNIYRSNSRNGFYRLVGRTRGDVYIDTDLTMNKKYYYKVKSYYVSGVGVHVLSSFSNVSYAIPTLGAPKVSFSKVNGTSLTLKVGKIYGASSYKIYRYNSKSGKYVYKGRLTNSRYFTDKGLKTKTVYKYKVVPYRGDKAGKYRIVSKKTKSSSVGTYIKVSISKQRLYFYKNYELYLTSNVVTGMRGVHDTPKGTYKIQYKTRNTYLTGADYRSFVNYWMPFYGGYGLHDATWRSSFGGDIYKYGGSHGCVNLPLSKAKKIYNNSYAGMRVVIAN